MEIDIYSLGQRIVIFGMSYAGKSTLAKKLGGELNLPVHHLDLFKYDPNDMTVRVPMSVFLDRVAGVTQHDHWIVEGAYSKALPSQLARATAVINLRLHRLECLRRYLRLCQAVKQGREVKLGVRKAEVELSLIKISSLLARTPKTFGGRSQLSRFGGTIYTMPAMQL